MPALRTCALSRFPRSRSPNPFNGSSSSNLRLPGLGSDPAVNPWYTPYKGHDAEESLSPQALVRLTGANAVGDARLGAVRKLRAMLYVRGSDGVTRVVTTNAGSFAKLRRSASKRTRAGSLAPIATSWTCGSGALLADDVYDGCTWDSRLETLGWDMPGYAPTPAWPAAVLASDPGGVNGPAIMSAQAFPEVSIVTILSPHTINQPSPGVYVLDFEQNFSGEEGYWGGAPMPSSCTRLRAPLSRLNPQATCA